MLSCLMTALIVCRLLYMLEKAYIHTGMTVISKTELTF